MLTNALECTIAEIMIFFSFSLELIPCRRGVSHSDPLPPHVYVSSDPIGL